MAHPGLISLISHIVYWFPEHHQAIPKHKIMNIPWELLSMPSTKKKVNKEKNNNNNNKDQGDELKGLECTLCERPRLTSYMIPWYRITMDTESMHWELLPVTMVVLKKKKKNLMFWFFFIPWPTYSAWKWKKHFTFCSKVFYISLNGATFVFKKYCLL